MDARKDACLLRPNELDGRPLIIDKSSSSCADMRGTILVPSFPDLCLCVEHKKTTVANHMKTRAEAKHAARQLKSQHLSWRSACTLFAT